MIINLIGQDVATKLEIKAMPTFVVLKDGAVVDKTIGANPEEIKRPTRRSSAARFSIDRLRTKMQIKNQKVSSKN